jgi:multiple sugar transport system ATP-binding protein
MAEIRIERLHKRFGAFVAVEDSSLTVGDGEFFVLLGPSGCGKTTTLRMIAGLEIPTSGEIALDGEDVTFRRARQRDIAFVFQLFALYPHMSVRRNIAFPLVAQRVARAEVRRRVEETARLLRIEDLLDRPVGGLSGGDRQRVALGRAIVRRPKAFLMDEPLGALDAEFRSLMCEELRLLHQRIGATTVYVTHDQIEAMSMADRIAVMDRGVILQCGTPGDIYHRPRSMFVADFIGSPSMSFLEAHADGREAVRVGAARFAVPRLNEPAPADLVLGIRPEHLRLCDASALRGEVVGIEYMGARQVITVDSAAGRARLRCGNDVRLRFGETVGLDPDPDRVVLFERGSGRALDSALFAAAGHG